MLRAFGLNPTPEQSAAAARAILHTEHHQHRTMTRTRMARAAALALGWRPPLPEWAADEIRNHNRNNQRNRNAC